MNKFLLSVGLSASSLMALVGPASAGIFRWPVWQPVPCPPTPTPISVPEIDASTGLLAMAVIVAAMLLVWERSRMQHL